VTQLDIATAPRRNSRHWKQSKISWEELLGWLDDPADTKESGNYVLGVLKETTAIHEPGMPPCTHLHRTKIGLVSRCALTLDVDHPAVGFLDRLLELLKPYQAVVHTTFSSTPDFPRYRVIIVLDRALAPDEYHAAAAVMMERLGEESFDPGSVEPERYMFKPSAKEADWFESWTFDGAPASADELLANYDPDLSKLPVPKKVLRTKRDPFELAGAVGAFNRAYTIDEAIEEYELPYESDGANRWHLVGASSASGMTLVSEGIVYSHHVNDPAFNQAASAFDLVRLHMFGDLDEDADPKTPLPKLPSYNAMLEVAGQDSRVLAEMVGLDFKAIDDSTPTGGGGDDDNPLADAWKLNLRFSPRSGKLIDDIANWDVIRDHDPVFAGLYWNELTLAVETETPFPWRPLERGGNVVTSIDRAALCHYLEREYRVRPSRGFVDELVDTKAQGRFVNPVRDYLAGLTWDGVERIETSLPGVRPTPYTRLVARKSLVAAVARIFEPGIKWDHTLVLYGEEGRGKSYWIEKLARGYSATLGPVSSKDTLITMQRSWIMVADEGHSLRKADADATKEFLTRTEDVFRMPYDREALAHKRHSVIWSTTNDEVFLRRQEGNRRFLIVRCEDKVDFSLLTDEYVDQLWAEAVHLYRAGELLYLSSEESAAAAAEREHFTEEDALGGVLQEYLDTLVPEDWDKRGPAARAEWLYNRSSGLAAEGTVEQTHTCSAQLWVEALGKRFGDHKRTDLLEINAALKRLPGWAPLRGRRRVPGYGPQLVFVRTTVDGEDLI